MLLQLENAHRGDIDKLLAFAKQNHLKLSLLDDSENYQLPGKPLTEQQITQLIEDSRKSGIISMQRAHKVIRNNYNGG
ncbi:MAG: hypothetical protein ABIO55_09940 [Ginsengibacter sp.]